MTEMVIIPGEHKCGKTMDMRILPDDGTSSKPFWIIYGFCKKCDMVIVSNIFTDKEPIRDVDFIIDYTKKSEK
jgi:hypothetical protein